MTKEKKPTSKSKPLNNYVKFSGMAIQMGLTIAIGAWGGSKLDEKFNTKAQLFTIIFSLLAIAISLYIVIREVIKMQKEDEDEG
jgi:membrane protein DedA with SNARE-associated domain